MRLQSRRKCVLTGVLTGLLLPSIAYSQQGDSGIGSSSPAFKADSGNSFGDFLGIDGFRFSGFVRSETAAKINDDQNPFNQNGNPFNGQQVQRTGQDPNTGELVTDTVTRTGPRGDTNFNVSFVRTELNLDINFTRTLSFNAKLRGIFEPNGFSDLDPDDVPGANPTGPLQQEVNLFEQRVNSGGRVENGGTLQGRESPNALEVAGDDFFLDLPKFYFNYNDGPLQVRLGNQAIAWGQAIFFRVLDVPNGLDLRRHSLLDYVPEEFSDKRVPSPALRVQYRLGGMWEVDAFAQHFRPTVLSNPNTPFSTIGSQFTVHDQYGDVDDKVNFGMRTKGPLGPFNFQFIAARRYNPLGTFAWTQSGVNRSLTGAEGDPTGPLLAQTPFERDPTGVNSAEEWFEGAGRSRLDAVEGLNASITEFPASQQLGSEAVANEEQARVLLDTFYQASGGLRGHIAREYNRETVLGFGASHRFSGSGILDQLIANIEVQYARDRHFTNPSLSRERIVEDEWTTALILEKFQRFSYRFPATFFVLQWLHKTESDIFGRHLSGMGGNRDRTARNSRTPDGADYIAFAIQQPFPSLTWRADFSALYDVEGGAQLQPAIRWKPSSSWAAEVFANILVGDIGGTDPNFNALSTFDYADEITARVTYQF